MMLLVGSAAAAAGLTHWLEGRAVAGTSTRLFSCHEALDTAAPPSSNRRSLSVHMIQ